MGVFQFIAGDGVTSGRRGQRGFLAILFSVAATGLLASATSPSACGDLITDGSFETPVVPAGGYNLYSRGASFGGISGNAWTVVGAAGNVSLASATYNANGFSFPAEDGTQWLDLTGTSNSATGVEQTVSTTAGDSYQLSFYVGNVVDTSPNGFGTTSTVDLSIDGAPDGTYKNSGGGKTLDWEQFTVSFTAASNSTVIQFLNGDPSNDNSNGLDNVSLVNVVPLPGSAVGGALLIGLLAKFRRRLAQ